MKKYLNTEFEEFFTPKKGIRILNPQKNPWIFRIFFGGCTRISLSEEPLASTMILRWRTDRSSFSNEIIRLFYKFI